MSACFSGIRNISFLELAPATHHVVIMLLLFFIFIIALGLGNKKRKRFKIELRILHSSDWHLGRFLNSFSLIDDQAHFLKWLLSLLKNERINLLVVAGDIFNTATPSAEAVSLLDEFLTKAVLELKVKVLMVSGNHDSARKLGFSSKILQKGGLFVAGGLSGLEKFSFSSSFGKVQVCMMPFFSLVEAREFFKLKKNCEAGQVFELILNKFNLNSNEWSGCFNLLCAHGLFVGQGHGLNFCDSELIVGGSEAFNLGLFKNFDYVALGHLHGPQRAGENGFYSGSPLKYSISEVNHRKQVSIVEVQSESMFKTSPVFVEPLHDLRVLQGSFCELMEQKSNDYVSLRLTDSNFIINSYSRLQERFPNILDIKFINLNFESSGELKSFKANKPYDLFFNFYEDIIGREMNKVERKIFAEVVEGLKKNETN